MEDVVRNHARWGSSRHVVVAAGVLDVGEVGVCPVGEGDEHLADRPAERGQGVLDPDRHLGVEGALDEAVAFEAAQRIVSIFLEAPRRLS